ncbi:MAG TPA: CocE/NonD family hydrolase [Acidimicrobiales bacterium]|nr:CocE/NonD family hydrolase [Acidimicrobiales bacterium]
MSDDDTKPTPESRRAGAKAMDALATRLSGLSPATTDYTVARHVRIPMRDGVELAADLYRPTSDVIGTILVRGPYGRSLALAMSQVRIFAARGYNAFFVSSRGTFGSGGEFRPMETEVDDGLDVVAWMRDQPWFTGTFATVGGSYLGHTQWALMTDPPPELAAAIVSIGPHDFHQHVWGTGAFRLDFLGWSYGVVHQEDGGGLAGALRTITTGRRIGPHMDTLPLTEAASTILGGRAPWYADWVTRPEATDPFWAPMQHAAALERVEIPVLLIGGWQDLFLEQTVHQYERLRARGVDVAMTVGDWSHLAVGAGGMRATSQETLGWLDEHLAHRSTGRGRTSPVRIFVSGSGSGGAGWRDLPDWPPKTSEHTLFLRADRSLSEDAPTTTRPASTFTFDPAHPTPTVGGPLLAFRCSVDDSKLAERSDVLTFTGPVLAGDLDVIGAPVIRLTHASDNPHADLFVRISEVDRKGRSHNITEGYVRLEPDRPAGADAEADAEVTLTLRPTAHRFQAGTRLRVYVAGGCHPQFSRNLGTGENPGTGVTMRPARHTVGHHPDACSSLLLPVAVAPEP